MAAAGFDLIGGAGGSFASAFGAFSTAKGYDAQEAAYGTAAAIALSNSELEGKNIGLSKESTAIQDRQLRVNAIMNRIQQTQQARKTYQIVGATNAAIGASGLASSGSSLDVLRSNTQQAYLDEAIVKTQGEVIEQQREQNATQGEINLVNIELQQKSFQQQAAAYLGEAAGASAAATASRAKGGGDIFSGVVKAIGAILSFL